MSTQISDRTRKALAERSQGRCEKCGNARATQAHHRRPRGMGGASLTVKHGLSSLLHLCDRCHGRVEGNRARALSKGWLIDQNDPLPADKIPVLASTINFGVARVLLSDDGGVDLAPGDDCVDCEPLRADVMA